MRETDPFLMSYHPHSRAVSQVSFSPLEYVAICIQLVQAHYMYTCMDKDAMFISL